MMRLLDDLINPEFLGSFCYRTELDRRYWRAWEIHSPHGPRIHHDRLIMDDYGNLTLVEK